MIGVELLEHVMCFMQNIEIVWYVFWAVFVHIILVCYFWVTATVFITSLFSTHHVCFLGYFEGIVGNLELMPIYYPGWVMRLYYDLDDNDPITEVI